MLLQQLVGRARQRLENETRAVIEDCVRDAWRRFPSPQSQPQEPDFVASLVKKGTSELGKRWDATLSPLGISVEVGGVYCHQSPKVTYTGMQGKSCEIGDLL